MRQRGGGPWLAALPAADKVAGQIVVFHRQGQFDQVERLVRCGAEGGELAGVGQGLGRMTTGGVELWQEVQEVVGVLSGGIETDDEGDGRVTLGDVCEALSELGVAVGGLGEL